MSEQEVIELINKHIGELVVDKTTIQKCYNYYNGVRDAEQFQYLEDNYGIGQPTSVEFTPLIKKHLDALIGEYLGTPIIPKVTCKDEKTVSTIFREKQIYIYSELQKIFQQKLKNNLIQVIQGKDPTDIMVQNQLEDLVGDLEDSFISKYEEAAQNVIEYIMQSRNTDLINKLRKIFLDLLISGDTFYRVKPSANGTNIQIESPSPLNTFPERNPNSPYVKDCSRIVIRKWLTEAEVLNTYGKDLSKEDIEKIKDRWANSYSSSSTYIRTTNGKLNPGIQSGVEIIPGYPKEGYLNHRLIEVYEVEWIETDSDFVMHRHSATKIGTDIYIIDEVDKDVVRTQDNPSKCTLSVNGVFYLNENSEPYSLVKACMTLQDKYDLLCYYRDNLIATSGTTGEWLDISLIPAKLGVNFSERVQKWLAYKKSGLGLIDTSQEGRMASGQAPINTIFNGFDDTIKVQSIQAIQLAIDSIEQTVSSITGVFKERLNGISQKDAVTNVQTSVNNSFVITKQYYHQMDILTEEILIDCLNTGKKVYKKGLTGIINLGDKQQKIFTALPENFTVTDYGITVKTSSDITQEIEQMKQILPQLIQAQLLPADILFETITCKSLTSIKTRIRKALAKQKAENNQLQQAMQQVQQLQQQLQESQKQIQKYEQQIQQLAKQADNFKQEELKQKMDLEWFKAQTDRQFKDRQAEEDAKRTELERQQLYDGNPYNDKVKQLRS